MFFGWKKWESWLVVVLKAWKIQRVWKVTKMRIIKVKRLDMDYSSNRVLICQFRLKYIRKREWYCIDFDVNTKIIMINNENNDDNENNENENDEKVWKEWRYLQTHSPSPTTSQSNLESNPSIFVLIFTIKHAYRSHQRYDILQSMSVSAYQVGENDRYIISIEY